MKNVLIISATDTIGGAEIVLYDFLKENRFHNFYILTSNNKMIEKGYKDVLGDKVFCSKVLSGYNFKGNPILTFYRLIFAVVEPAVVPLNPSGVSKKIYVLAFILLSIGIVIFWKFFGGDLLTKFRDIRPYLFD